MPIYEYYCPQNHTVYQFYAKTLAQGQRIPPCPDNPAWPMQKVVSTFAIGSRAASAGVESVDDPSQPPVGNRPFGAAGPGAPHGDDPRVEAAMRQLEGEFAHVDENDPRAMARLMRRMAEATGETIDPQMDEVVRKLEEGMSPDALEERMEEFFGKDEGGEGGEGGFGHDAPDGSGVGAIPPAQALRRGARVRRAAPRRDPQLYDYAD